MTHYTVGYHDTELKTHEICEYAESAYDAIEHSKEDVPFLEGHPHFIDYCLKTLSDADKHYELMSSGIPMGH